MTEPIVWPALIGDMIRTKNEIVDLDPDYYDDYTLPSEKASEDDIAAFERWLGEELPSEYRAFLRHANGWRLFYWDADLFSFEEMRGGSARAAATNMLETYEREGVLAGAGLQKEHLLPIGGGAHSTTLFVLFTAKHVDAGQVSWLNNEEVDRYSGFAEFFASITAYFKAHAESLRGTR